ncbi:Amine oxidase family protein [Elusimicrobium minutum Pei191]|uniref:Amine oxidase family protein n=1 Tax=Elusimicrobium minutum (strain Pei191) TaxID=445932 RepID=B2KD52_ELUMP|nr:FAD-dependent oxidoreductase [Elusimicrobium minutum]ACC98448.1 Amine oxidase family protein [Elusimicrobium minutum Pei191]
MKTDILIIGAGITGLSAAYHIGKKRDFLLLEQDSEPGGLCKSIEQDGFTFDYSGHVAHVQSEYVRALLKKLLAKNVSIVKRKAFAYLQDTMVPFPFQANLSYLKEDIVEECVRALMKESKNKKKSFDNFKQWAAATYGEGICKYFMFPYNEKLWQAKVEELSTAWCSTYVPKTDLEDIIKGAYFKQKENFGYNTHFFYPKKGGIGALTKALAQKTNNIIYNTQVKEIDLKNKKVITNNGEFEYNTIINTTPLKPFTSLCKGLPQEVYEKADKLKHNVVYVLNLGVNREIKNISWIYFPEEKFKFYRVGVQSSFSQEVAPPGAGALYVEISAKPGAKKPNFKELQKEIIKNLVSCDIIKKEDKILTSLWLTINPAYACYNLERETIVPCLTKTLAKHNVVSAGRYGSWEYSFMERNLLEGKVLGDEASAKQP